MKRSFLFAVALVGLTTSVYSQQRVKPADLDANTALNKNGHSFAEDQSRSHPRVNPGESSSKADAEAGSSTPSGDYLFGPGDLLTVSETELNDLFLDKTFRVDNSGDVSFPLAGRIHALGLSASALQTELNAHLARILKAPDAVIGIAEFHSQPISILGAVNYPGVHQLQGSKSLFEVISLAGGLSQTLAIPSK